ncbi:MAG: aldehyde dehydrogenase family protein [Pseudomonadales bacterium]
MSTTELEELQRAFAQQKQQYSPATPISFEQRIHLLEQIDNMIRQHIDEISAALLADFGSRSADWIFTAEIFPILDHIKHVKKKLKTWMKPEPTSSGLLAITGQRTYIQYEPLGVVGVMSPFNAPVSLGFDPAIDAIAAGNRVMIKISEQTPVTAQLLKRLADSHIEASYLSIVCGELDISQAFVALPWDSLLFTGGTQVGKQIMASAAPNLTPVILELGGKCPCVLLPDANLEMAAHKIAQVRQLNAGQVCIAADYVLLPESLLEGFISSALAKDLDTYPAMIDNSDVTAIINDQHYQRICSWIDEARAAGCRVVQAERPHEVLPDRQSRKIPLTLIVNPSKDLSVARQEVFGPVLTVFTYRELDTAINAINSRPKALALYVFGQNRKQIDHVVNSTSSGGVTINDLLMHAGSHTMGFGGVGESGMGRYKGGIRGFQAFSNPKSVHVQGLLKKYTGQFFPPYKKQSTRKMLRGQVGVHEVTKSAR